MGIYPLLVFVSSVHSTLGNRAAHGNRRKKKVDNVSHLMHTQADAHARYLAEPRAGGQNRYPGLGVDSIPLNLSLCGQVVGDRWTREHCLLREAVVSRR